MIKAIIFDCFGVLVGRGFAETYRLAGGDPRADAAFIEDMLGQANLGQLTSSEFHQQMADKLGIGVAEYNTAVIKAEQPNLELIDYITELHRTYKTAVLSNANVGTLERKLDQQFLASAFDSLIVSAEVGLVKPDPEIYRLAAAKLGVAPEECVFVDDQARYCEGAGNTGMRTIVYRDFHSFREQLAPILAK